MFVINGKLIITTTLDYIINILHVRAVLIHRDEAACQNRTLFTKRDKGEGEKSSEN